MTRFIENEVLIRQGWNKVEKVGENGDDVPIDVEDILESLQNYDVDKVPSEELVRGI